MQKSVEIITWKFQSYDLEHFIKKKKKDTLYNENHRCFEDGFLEYYFSSYLHIWKW